MDLVMMRKVKIQQSNCIQVQIVTFLKNTIVFVKGDSPLKCKSQDLAWFPFGYGPRGCLGLQLAQLEIQLALIMLYRNYTFEIVGSKELDIYYKVTLYPRKPMHLKVMPRQ